MCISSKNYFLYFLLLLDTPTFIDLRVRAINFIILYNACKTIMLILLTCIFTRFN